jgi:hypothetical protein
MPTKRKPQRGNRQASAAKAPIRILFLVDYRTEPRLYIDRGCPLEHPAVRAHAAGLFNVLSSDRVGTATTLGESGLRGAVFCLDIRIAPHHDASQRSIEDFLREAFDSLTEEARRGGSRTTLDQAAIANIKGEQWLLVEPVGSGRVTEVAPGRRTFAEVNEPMRPRDYILKENDEGQEERLTQRAGAAQTATMPREEIIERYEDDLPRVRMPEADRDLSAEARAAQVAESMSALAGSFLEHAVSAEARTELAKRLAVQLAGKLPEPIRGPLGIALTVGRRAGGATVAHVREAIVLTVAEMQQELDERTGKSFGSAAANRSEINKMKGYLKASNLKLIYTDDAGGEHDVTINLKTPPRTREGSFELTTATKKPLYIASSPTWPPLKAAPRD